MISTAVKSDTSLEIRRTFSASRKRMFDAWTNPELLARWFHPSEGMSTTVSQLDLEIGGHYRFIMHGNEQDHVIGGVYQEIEPLEKLAFTWQWESEAAAPQMLVTVSFNEIDDQNTELVLFHERFPHIEERDNHEQGWNGTFNELEKVL